MDGNILEWLDGSEVAVAIRQSSWLFPAIEIVHIVGFAVLIGSAFLFDLRLLGISRSISVTSLANHLLPWSRRSLFLVVPSGALLFISQAKTIGSNGVFGLKLLLILFAISNAGLFHWFIFPSVDQWDAEKPSPPAAKLAAIISLVCWTSVVVCGRLIAYK
jgi:hypothetical protein